MAYSFYHWSKESRAGIVTRQSRLCSKNLDTLPANTSESSIYIYIYIYIFLFFFSWATTTRMPRAFTIAPDSSCAQALAKSRVTPPGQDHKGHKKKNQGRGIAEQPAWERNPYLPSTETLPARALPPVVPLLLEGALPPMP
jgi:hypothetical protein